MQYMRQIIQNAGFTNHTDVCQHTGIMFVADADYDSITKDKL